MVGTRSKSLSCLRKDSLINPTTQARGWMKRINPFKKGGRSERSLQLRRGMSHQIGKGRRELVLPRKNRLRIGIHRSFFKGLEECCALCYRRLEKNGKLIRGKRVFSRQQQCSQDGDLKPVPSSMQENARSCQQAERGARGVQGGKQGWDPKKKGE